MGNKKRVNPSRRPATGADVERAKKEATNQAIKRILYLVLYVLIDKHDAPYEDIQQFSQEINYYADSITKGYISWKDIERVVVDEYNVSLPW